MGFAVRKPAVIFNSWFTWMVTVFDLYISFCIHLHTFFFSHAVNFLPPSCFSLRLQVVQWEENIPGSAWRHPPDDPTVPLKILCRSLHSNTGWPPKHFWDEITEVGIHYRIWHLQGWKKISTVSCNHLFWTWQDDSAEVHLNSAVVKLSWWVTHLETHPYDAVCDITFCWLLG